MRCSSVDGAASFVYFIARLVYEAGSFVYVWLRRSEAALVDAQPEVPARSACRRLWLGVKRRRDTDLTTPPNEQSGAVQLVATRLSLLQIAEQVSEFLHSQLVQNSFWHE